MGIKPLCLFNHSKTVDIFFATIPSPNCFKSKKNPRHPVTYITIRLLKNDWDVFRDSTWKIEFSMEPRGSDSFLDRAKPRSSNRGLSSAVVSILCGRLVNRYDYDEHRRESRGITSARAPICVTYERRKGEKRRKDTHESGLRGNRVSVTHAILHHPLLPAADVVPSLRGLAHDTPLRRVSWRNPGRTNETRDEWDKGYISWIYRI